jgi:hypothetical protein
MEVRVLSWAHKKTGFMPVFFMGQRTRRPERWREAGSRKFPSGKLCVTESSPLHLV